MPNRPPTDQVAQAGQPRLIRKVVVMVVGGLIVLLGVALLFLPGPGLVVIPAGFAILASEFEWARHWLRKVKGWLKRGLSSK